MNDSIRTAFYERATFKIDQMNQKPYISGVLLDHEGYVLYSSSMGIHESKMDAARQLCAGNREFIDYFDF